MVPGKEPKAEHICLVAASAVVMSFAFFHHPRSPDGWKELLAVGAES